MSWGADWLTKGLESVQNLMENVDKTAAKTIRSGEEANENEEEDFVNPSEPLTLSASRKSVLERFNDDADADMFGFLDNKKIPTSVEGPSNPSPSQPSTSTAKASSKSKPAALVAQKLTSGFTDVWDDFDSLAAAPPKKDAQPEKKSNPPQKPSTASPPETQVKKGNQPTMEPVKPVPLASSWDFDDFGAAPSPPASSQHSESISPSTSPGLPRAQESADSTPSQLSQSQEVISNPRPSEPEERSQNQSPPALEPVQIITGNSPKKDTNFTLFIVPDSTSPSRPPPLESSTPSTSTTAFNPESSSDSEASAMPSEVAPQALPPSDPPSFEASVPIESSPEAESPRPSEDSRNPEAEESEVANNNIPPPTEEEPALPTKAPSPRETREDNRVSEEILAKQAIMAQKIAQLATENEQLRGEVKTLNTELRDISKQYKALQKELKMSERELEIAREGLGRHQLQFERSKGEIEQQHLNTIKAQEAKIKELNTRISEIEISLAQANAKHDAALLKLSGTEAELQRAVNDQEQKEELLKILRSQVDNLSDENITSRRDLDDLQRGHMNELRDLEEKIRALHHELVTEREASKIATAKAQHLIALKEAEIAASKLASPSKLTASTSILNEADLSEIDTVSVTQYQVLLKENKKLLNQIKGLEGELEISKSQLMEMQMRWDSDKELVNAEIANERATKKNLQIEHQLALQQTRNRLDSAQTEMTELKEKYVKAQGEVDALKIELSSLKRSRPTSSHTSSEFSMLTADDPSRRVNELTEHLMNKQRHIEIIESEKSALQVRVETLAKELQNMKANEAESAIIDMGIVDHDYRRRGAASGKVKQTSMASLIANWQPHSGLPLQIQSKTHRSLEAIDHLTARLGYYLRASPAFRLFVILYFVLVHLFLMYILVQWSHDMGPQKEPHEIGAKEHVQNVNKVGEEPKQ